MNPPDPERERKPRTKKMAVFKTCCCCLSLRTGCIIMGVLEILSYLSVVAAKNSSPASIFLMLVGLIASALLIYGAIKRNRFCLWPWIVVNIIAIIVFIIGVLLCAFASAIIVDIFQDAQAQGAIQISEKETEEAKAAITVFVVIVAVTFLISIGIVTLFTLVAYSYVCELREEEERQHNDTNAPPKAYNLVPV